MIMYQNLIQGHDRKNARNSTSDAAYRRFRDAKGKLLSYNDKESFDKVIDRLEQIHKLEGDSKHRVKPWIGIMQESQRLRRAAFSAEPSRHAPIFRSNNRAASISHRRTFDEG